MSATNGTSSPYTAPTNLELKPEWPLFSSEHTMMSLLTGMPRIPSPPPTATIVEPTFTASDQQLIDQLRADATTHLREHGLTASDANPVRTLHWRDVYNAHRHLTTVQPTPDPRHQPDYRAPAPPTAWPDYQLHQFLVARKRQPHKALRMLLDWAHWWVHFGLDDLCAQEVCPFGPEVAAFAPERIHGVDKAGRPFIVGHAGGIDLDAYAAVGLPLEACYIFQTYKREFMRRVAMLASARCGRRVTDFAVVTDLTGFTLAHRLGIPWVKNQAHIDNNYYPETAGQIIVIAAPGFFSWVYSILKGFIDERTQEKISILSHDYTDVVNTRIGHDNTPVEWKGACSLCDGHCLPVTLARDTAAEARRQAAVVAGLEGGAGAVAREVTIPARHVHEERLAVEAKGGTADGAAMGQDVCSYTVWWSVALPAKDIDFSVSFKPNHGDAYTVKAVQRIAAGGGESEDGRVRGTGTVRVGAQEGGGGQVIVTFSNLFSMFSGKHVDFKVGVQQESAK